MKIVLPRGEYGQPSQAAVDAGERLAERAKAIRKELDATVSNVTDKAVLRLIARAALTPPSHTSNEE